MNNIEKIFSQSNNIQDFAKGYFNYLNNVLNNIDLKSLEHLVESKSLF